MIKHLAICTRSMCFSQPSSCCFDLRDWLFPAPKLWYDWNNVKSEVKSSIKQTWQYQLLVSGDVFLWPPSQILQNVITGFGFNGNPFLTKSHCEGSFILRILFLVGWLYWGFQPYRDLEAGDNNLWNLSGEAGNRTPDLLLRKPRA